MTSNICHIHIDTTPPPPGGYPADFAVTQGDTCVKYGDSVFEGRSQRGGDYWTAKIITQSWYQAETGRIPISGAGYGSKFAGEWFDNLWPGPSEIMRPTRDGIHGREYKSNQVDVGVVWNFSLRNTCFKYVCCREMINIHAFPDYCMLDMNRCTNRARIGSPLGTEIYKMGAF